MKQEEKELIKYFKELGLTVNTRTKARGHQGFFLRNRIDISKNVPEHKIMQTLLHEFAHYIHSQIEPEIHITGGRLETLFGYDIQNLEEELFKVTNFVDENSLCIRLYEHKDRVREKIKEYESVIKKEYPKFLRSKPFKEFNKYIKKSDARFLLKYDRIKLVTGFWTKRTRLLSVSNIETDFPDMPESFAAYIKLKSAQKKQSRISSRINKLRKYYMRPTELFARFIEGLYLDKEWVQAIAPETSKAFYKRLKSGYFEEMVPIAYKYL